LVVQIGDAVVDQYKTVNGESIVECLKKTRDFYRSSHTIHNPIERLWQVMNKHARNRQYFATAKEFREPTDRFFRITRPDIAGSLKSTINNYLQKLKSAI
jgi:hypothetical protein